MTVDSPLATLHGALGATLTEFAGWNMPLRYGSELAEHHVVRNAVGLFDLSHMAEIIVEGPGAAAALDAAVVGWISRVEVGRARYTMMCAEDGGVIDDLVVYRLALDRFMIVANAGNAAVVAHEIVERCAGFDCRVRDDSASTALIAVQGPHSPEVVARMLDSTDGARVLALRYYASASATLAGTAVLVGRTGYTGEDGFEFFVPFDIAEATWNLALSCGTDANIAPCGLAARDTLRLEAGMPLYGHELTRETTPFDAGLGRVVHLGGPDDTRGSFVGREALKAAAADAAAWEADPDSAPDHARVLVGLVGDGRRSPRAGYSVLSEGLPVGEVTSGAPSPTLGRQIAMAYVHPSVRTIATGLGVDVRGRREEMTVTALPFYQRHK